MPFCHRALNDVSIAPVTMETNISSPHALLHLWISPFPLSPKLKAKMLHFYYLFIYLYFTAVCVCVCVPHISLVPSELRGGDGLWEYLMTSVFPSRTVSFQMWNLGNPCRRMTHTVLCSDATHIVMCQDWQTARLSPQGIVDFSQEGCLLLKMCFRRTWHLPLPTVLSRW